MATPGIALPPLVQRIVLDPSGLKATTAATTRAMAPVGKAAAASAVKIGAMSTSLNTLSFRAQTTGRMLFKQIGMPILLIGGLAVAAFVKFEQSLIKIQALVGISAGAVRGFREEIVRISEATGRFPQELADAMFFVTSAGLRGANALEVLEASAKGAAIGLGTTAVVADAATSAVNAYGSENLSGAEAVDILTAAVREGKVEATKLTPAIGKAIPVASAMGIEFHEVAAAISAMTRTGTDARTSAIQLRQIMQSILDPSRQAAQALLQMGVAEGELVDMARNKGLLAVLARLRDLSEENAEAFADVFPNVRAMAGAMDITGENLQENTQIFEQLANAVGDTDQAMLEVEKSGAHKLRLGMAKLMEGITNFGDSLKPVITALAGVLKALGWVFNFLSKTPVIAGAIAGIGLLSATFGMLLIVIGRVAQGLIFLSAALTKYTAATTGAAIATGRLALALKALQTGTIVGLFVTLALTIGVLAFTMFGFGRKTKSTHRELSDLRQSMRDVRSAGEELIIPIEGITGALRSLRAESAEAKLVERFDEAFGDTIEDSFSEQNFGGGIAGEDAIVRFFFGRGDTPAVRMALQNIVDDVNDQIGPGSDAFMRLFGSGTDASSDRLTEFLTGSETGIRQGLVIRGQLAADALQMGYQQRVAKIADGRQGQLALEAIYGTVEAARSTMPRGSAELVESYDFTNLLLPLIDDEAAVERWIMDGTGVIGDVLANYDFAGKFPEGAKLSEDVLIGALGDTDAFTTLLEPFVLDMNDLFKDQKFADFGIAWTGFVDAVTKGRPPAEAARKVQVFTNAFMEQMDVVSLFKDIDFGDAESVPDLLGMISDAIGSKGADNEPFAGREMIELFAASYVDAMESMQGPTARITAGMSDAEKESFAWAHALSVVEDASANVAGELGPLAKNIEDVFNILETAFSTADEAAKKMTKRFDDLIGRTMNASQAQDDYNMGLIEMSQTLLENGGSLDRFTEAGMANRTAIREQVEAAKDYGAILAEGGADTEEVEAQVMAAIGVIKSNALKMGADEGLLGALFTEIDATPERLALVLADDDDPVSEAFSDVVQSIQEQSRGFVGNLYSGLGEDMTEGMVRGIAVGEQDVLDQVKHLVDSIFEAAVAPPPVGIGASSPSTLFQDEFGEAIIDGAVQGIVQNIPKVENAIQQLIDHALGAVRSNSGIVSGSISAMLDFEKAQRDLDRLQTTAGGKGIDTRFEELTQKRLQTAVKDAERALRLGQGNMHDLELALDEAKFALDDFEAAATRGDELTRAELRVTDAGLKVIESQAALLTAGEAAADAFTAVAEAAGLSETAIQGLLDQKFDGSSVLEKFADDETLTALALVGIEIGTIAEDLASIQVVVGDLDLLGPTVRNEEGDWQTEDSFVRPPNLAGMTGGYGLTFDEAAPMVAGTVETYHEDAARYKEENSFNTTNINLNSPQANLWASSMGNAIASGEVSPTLGGELHSAIREATVMGIFDGWLGQIYSAFSTGNLSGTRDEVDTPVYDSVRGW